MPQIDADVLVLAGDIGVGLQGVEQAREWATRMPVIYVPGNHEFYGQNWPSHIWAMRNYALDVPNLHILDNDELVLSGIRFLGCTLWTDFCLKGEATEAHARLVAARNIHDYDTIKGAENYLNPRQTQYAHSESVAWLKERLSDPEQVLPTVVVTHHAPSRLSLNPYFTQRGDDPLNPAYASNLDYLFGPGINLWIHGHVHFHHDYEVNGTRVVSNARGYIHDLVSGFDDQMVVEIP